MSRRARNACINILAIAIIISPLNFSVLAQNPPKSNRGGSSRGTSQTRRDLERHIEDRDRAQNGIDVYEPKVYDDSMLQQMLTAAQAKLASLQVLDQGTLVQKLGSVSGASQQYTSIGLTAQGPALPQTVTTNKGATESTQDIAKTSINTEGKTSTDNSAQTTTNAASQDVTKTVSSASSPSATAPTPATSLSTSGYSVSSSDILNEQMQLTYEIANLSLLLDGPLSDRILMGKNINMIKPRITLGFPIKISPDKRYRGAVAVVEVEVEKTGDLTEDSHRIVTEEAGQGVESGDGKVENGAVGEAPTITALLPREKTYNVASIAEKNLSIGGGVVTQVMGLSGSWLHGNRTYYLVKDQDTLALTFQPDGEPAARKKVGFLWQFRPVLGQEYVRAGLKETFVQLAFPEAWSAKSYGKVTVRSYWRRYDRKKGVVKEIIPGSLREIITDQAINNYKLELPPRNFDDVSLEDIGGGQMLVKLYGRFLNGTYIRIGSTFIKAGSPAMSFEYYGIRFIAPISDLATKSVALVARDGSEIPLEIKHLIPPPKGGTAPVKKPRPQIKDIKISTVDETNSLIKVELTDASFIKERPPLVMVIGGRVFGYSDSPIQREGDTLSAVVPTSWIIAHPEVTVKPLFAPKDFEDRRPLIDYDPTSQTERLLLFEQGKSSAKFILYGSRLGELKIIYPEDVKGEIIGGANDARTMLVLELTADQLKNYKQMILQRGDERPFVIALPTLEFKDAKPPDPKAAERITVNADEVVIQGAGFNDLVRVTFRGRSIPFEVSEDGKLVTLKKLRSHGVTRSATTQPLQFIFKDRKSTVNLEVVTTKVETVPK